MGNSAYISKSDKRRSLACIHVRNSDFSSQAERTLVQLFADSKRAGRVDIDMICSTYSVVLVPATHVSALVGVVIRQRLVKMPNTFCRVEYNSFGLVYIALFRVEGEVIQNHVQTLSEAFNLVGFCILEHSFQGNGSH
jgi:hypothetical protein